MVPRQSPFPITLGPDERVALEAMARKYTSPYRDVVRAKIVLLAATGLANDVIASRLNLPRQIVSKWRKRFFYDRLAGLEEAPRGGRPAAFPPASTSTLSDWPANCPVVPMCRWRGSLFPELRAEVLARGLVAQISGVTLWRWLSTDALQPWRHRSWIFPRDPHFAERAGRVLDLYAKSWESSVSGGGRRKRAFSTSRTRLTMRRCAAAARQPEAVRRAGRL